MIRRSSVLEPAEGDARFRASVEMLPVGVGHFGIDGRFIFANRQICDILGVSRDALLESTFQDVIFPDDVRRAREMTEQVAAGKIPSYTFERRFARPDASVYARVNVSVVRDEAGAVACFHCVVEDLSEHWVIEEARRQAEERTHLALEASGTGIFRYDFRARALDWTGNLGHIFGAVDPDQLMSIEQMIAAVHPDDRSQVVEALEFSARTGSDFDHDFRIVLPDGRIRWISDRARMTLEANGEPRYLTGACVDITALRESEIEREEIVTRERRARVEAEKATRVRDEVLAIVAHDLRSPVHAIVMSATVLTDLNLSNEMRTRHLAIIRRCAYTIDQLIRDLLDVTAIESGKLSINPAPIAVEAVLSEVRESFEQQAREQGVSLDVECEPSASEMFADPGRVTQVLSNLVGNALKFTPREGRIAVRARPAQDFVELSVADTGCGIPPDKLPRVFERFWQGDRGSQGVGLGLAIVRGIVDAHGGWAEAESTPGEGTTVRISLPSRADAMEART